MISLLEFLQSANKDKFASVLKKQFSEYIEEVKHNEDDDFPTWGKEVLIVYTNEPYNIAFETDFVRFCHRYQWFPSFLTNAPSHTDYDSAIILEPISKNKKHFDTVYHVTKKETWYKYIKEKGLICLGAKNRTWTSKDSEAIMDDTIHHEDKNFRSIYRTITPRVYVISDDKDIKYIADQVDIGKKQVVLKIDLSKHKNILAYKDNGNSDKVSAWYFLENIPPQLITIDKEWTDLINNKE